MSHNFSLDTIIVNRERQFVAPPILSSRGAGQPTA